MMKKSFLLPLVLCTGIFINIISCSKSDSTPEATPPPAAACAGTPGPLFTAVKNLAAQKCVGCHNANNPSGGQNFQVDCNIVASKIRIKVRAVDEGTMPPTGTLPQSDKNIITAWINAGGKLTD